MPGVAVFPPITPGHRRLLTVAVAGACLLAAAPLLDLVVQVLVGPALTWTGDQALVELGVREAGAWQRSLGAYSRFGWNHPGPLWLYLLAGPYRLLGADGRALGATVALSHALTAVLIVLTATRLRAPSLQAGSAVGAVSAAAAVLVLQHGFRPGAFVSPWNPYAVILPSLLFLLLAAGVLLRRPGWGVGASVAATFLVQTHIGTLPLVLVVAGTVLLVRVATASRSTLTARDRTPRSGRHRTVRFELPRTGLGRWQAAGWSLLLAAWLPPLLEQIFGGGNLSRIAHFVTTSRHVTTWHAGASVAGQLLYRTLLSRAPGRLDQLPAPAGGLTMLTLCLVAGPLLAALGYATQEPVSRACGAVSTAGVIAGVVAAHQTVGAHDPYLLFWLPAAPVPLLVGAVALLAGPLRHRASAATTSAPRCATGLGAARTVTVLATTAAGIVLALPLLGGIRIRDLPAARDSRPVSTEAAAVQRWLGPHHGPLLIRIVSHHLWPQAAGLLVRLRAQGQPSFVTPDWVPVFGTRQRLPRPTTLALDVSGRGTQQMSPAGSVLGTGRFGSTQLTLVLARVPLSALPLPPQP